MKTCTKCNILKELSEYNNSSRAKDGKKSSCRECARLSEKARKQAYEIAGRPVTPLTGTKICTSCNIDKPYTDYYRRGDASGNYKSQCKACIRPVLNKYKKDNPAKRTALAKKRRASIINRTPKWLTEDDYWMMELAYEHALEQSELHGIKFHVDHIIPLNGKYISGLHVPSNLQVIPDYENLSKSNKFTNPGIEDFIKSLTTSQLELAELANITLSY